MQDCLICFPQYDITGSRLKNALVKPCFFCIVLTKVVTAYLHLPNPPRSKMQSELLLWAEPRFLWELFFCYFCLSGSWSSLGGCMYSSSEPQFDFQFHRNRTTPTPWCVFTWPYGFFGLHPVFYGKMRGLSFAHCACVQFPNYIESEDLAVFYQCYLDEVQALNGMKLLSNMDIHQSFLCAYQVYSHQKKIDSCFLLFHLLPNGIVVPVWQHNLNCSSVDTLASQNDGLR